VTRFDRFDTFDICPIFVASDFGLTFIYRS